MTEGVGAGADTTTRPRRRRRVGWTATLLAVLVAVAAIWFWWTAPHRRLAAELDLIDLPASLVLLGSHASGDRTCFFDSCPELSRYYGSDVAPSELCRRVGDEVAGAEGPLEALEACTYRTRDGTYLTIGEPITEIPPDPGNKLIDTHPVETEHESVLVARKRR